jgi:hypothetical protein
LSLKLLAELKIVEAAHNSSPGSKLAHGAGGIKQARPSDPRQTAIVRQASFS